MRSKILCLLFTFIIIPSLAFAEEVSGTSASWSDISGAENAWDGQKMITNKEYEQVVNELEKRKNAKKIKAQKKAGDPLMKSGMEKWIFWVISKNNIHFLILQCP